MLLSSLATVVCIQFIILTIVHFLLHSHRAKVVYANRHSFLAVVAAVVVLQLGFAALQTKEVGDVLLFAGAGWHLRHQIDFYFIDSAHSQYPFFPFLIFLHAALNMLHEVLPIVTFSWYLKLTLTICLLAISWLLLKETESKEESREKVLQLLTHPITTLVVYFHGQVDVFLLLFLLMAVWWQKNATHTQHVVWSVCLFAASIAAKTWSVLLLPYFILGLKWRWRILTPLLIIVLLIGNVFVYTRLVDGSSVRTVLPAVTAAGGPIGEWGVSYLIDAPLFWKQYGVLLLGTSVVLVTLFVHAKRVPQWSAVLLIIFAIQMVLPRWGIQYLFWSVPLLYLDRTLTNRQHMLLIISAGLYAFFNYFNIAQEIEQQALIMDKKFVQYLGVFHWLILCYITAWLLRNQSSKQLRARIKPEKL